jgi:hypothetical protein
MKIRKPQGNADSLFSITGGGIAHGALEIRLCV